MGIDNKKRKKHRSNSISSMSLEAWTLETIHNMILEPRGNYQFKCINVARDIQMKDIAQDATVQHNMMTIVLMWYAKRL